MVQIQPTESSNSLTASFDYRRSGDGSNNDMSLWTWPWKSRNRTVRTNRLNRRDVLSLWVSHRCRLLYGLSMAFVLYLLGSLQSELLKGNEVFLAVTNESPISVAVLVAGSTQRFLFDSFLEHVGKPAQKNHWKMDYFAILTKNSGPAFRQDSGYMGHLAGYDKGFRKVFSSNSSSSSIAEDQKAFRAHLEHLAEPYSTTTIRGIQLLENPIEDDPVLEPIKKKQGGQNLFAQFPMMDLREKALNRTQAGNKNMIRLFLALERLWNSEVLPSEEANQSEYDYVLIVRDDALWLADFDVRKLIDSDPTADAFVLSCNDRKPPMLEPELNDHGIFIKRSKAHVVGAYVSSIAQLDLQKCHDKVQAFVGKQRGCNSEMILKHVLEENQVKVSLVPQSLLPFERSVRIKVDENEENDHYCYHKFCQSVEAPLSIPTEIPKCMDLTF